MTHKNTGRITSRMGRFKLCYEGFDPLSRTKPYMILESQQWRTPKWVVKRVCEFLNIPGFDLDACADRESSVASHYYGAHASCLTHAWDSPAYNYVWMNPPFGGRGVPKKRLREAGMNPEDFAPFPGVDVFIQRAKEQACKYDLTVAVCIPTATDMRRLELVWDADFELCLGRVAFEDLEGKAQKSPPGGHSVYVWSAGFGTLAALLVGKNLCSGPPRYLLRKN